MATAWAAEAARQVADTPIYMTYNFFLTAIGLPSIAFYIRLLIKSKEKRENEADELRGKLTEQWRAGAVQRTNTLCEKIDALHKRLDSKVDNHECDHHQNRTGQCILPPTPTPIPCVAQARLLLNLEPDHLYL